MLSSNISVPELMHKAIMIPTSGRYCDGNKKVRISEARELIF